MTTIPIPDAAVEAAAKVMYLLSDEAWERTRPPFRQSCMAEARATLEAAAQHLMPLVREQQARLDKVAALAEKWRYKGEFGWGAWQEGEGPDQEGLALDHAAGELRAVLTSTEASK